MNVTISESAAGFMRRMIRFNGGAAGDGFRLVVSPGGCSGFNSSFTVEKEPRQGDAVLDASGVKVFLPAESRILLAGVTVDFADSSLSTGLIFINPNPQACACNSSAPSGPTPAKTAGVRIADILRKR